MNACRKLDQGVNRFVVLPDPPPNLKTKDAEMKIEIEISEEELRKLVTERIAAKCIEEVWDENFELPYERRKDEMMKRRKEILSKIDWKNAGSQLSETVVQKFFMKLLDGQP